MKKGLTKILSILIINLLSSIKASGFILTRPVSSLITSRSFSTEGQRLLSSEWDIETALSFTTNHVAVTTVDPTTALSQVLGGIINTPLILFVPILVGLSVTAVIVWYIVSYANPTDPDD